MKCPNCGEECEVVRECPECAAEGCDDCLFPAGAGTICIECEENGEGDTEGW